MTEEKIYTECPLPLPEKPREIMKVIDENDGNLIKGDNDALKSKIWDLIIDKLQAEGYVTSPGDPE